MAEILTKGFFVQNWMASLLVSLFLCFSAHGTVVKCSAKELKLKNCVLRGEDIKVSFSETKIRFNYGPWTSIVNFPFSGLISDWKEVHLVQMAGRSFIEVKVWEEIEKEVSLEELHWRVMELERRKLVIHVDEVLGRRQKKVDKDGPVIKDVLHSTSLSQDPKTEEIKWEAGKKSGVIRHGI